MKNKIKLGLISIGVCLVLATATACGGGNDGASQQLAEVTRGDLMVGVSGSGNISVSDEARLTFGSSGKVNTIYVKEGEEVITGEVLATLDTDSLELALTQAHIAVTQAQIALKTAEYNLEQTQDLYTLSDIKVATSDVDEAERYLNEALEKITHYSPGSPGEEYWQRVIIHAQARLNAAEDKLDAMLAGADTEVVAIKKLQVEAAEQSLEQAEQSLEYAQKQLDEATITAPFGGTVASIAVDEGDTVTATTTIVYLIDLASMELEIGIDEIDIPIVKLNQEVVIEVDALPHLRFEGRVSSISLVPTVESGLMLYDATIEFDNPEDSGLRVGMSATADIIIEEQTNVLLVPNRAVQEDSEGAPIVMVMVEGQAQERAVVVGISGDLETEIVSGLQEGEMVIVPTRPQTNGLGIFG